MDNLYLGLDTGVSGALLRIVLGIVLVRAVEALNPDADLWTMSACLLVMLLAVKILAGAARRIASASTVVHLHWEWRRNLARYYDSYQWRKLLWFGTGILLGAAVHAPGAAHLWVLGLTCVGAGGVAEVLWRRHSPGIAPPAA